LLGLAEVGLYIGWKDGAKLPPHAANAFGAVIEVSLKERIKQLFFYDPKQTTLEGVEASFWQT
jgi:hypothetical protein